MRWEFVKICWGGEEVKDLNNMKIGHHIETFFVFINSS